MNHVDLESIQDSLIERDIIPQWVAQRGLTRCFVYNGPSMRPTFQNGQLLYVRPISQGLRPGDVLAFQDQEKHHFVIHRAVAVTPRGWLTRGDNNCLLDDEPVSLERVVGRVELVETQAGFHPVRNGLLGLWMVQLGRALRPLIGKLRFLLGAPYRSLRGWPPSRRWLRQRFASQLQTVHLEMPEGPIVRTLWRGKVVAHWHAAQRRFECRKPFDLFLEPPE